MVKSDIERIMARRQIKAIIDSDPVDVMFTRVSMIPDGAGGYKRGTPTPIAAQTVTIIPFKRRFSEMMINTELGDVTEYPYTIVGMPGLDVQRGDIFTWAGDQYEVHQIDPMHQDVRVVAQIDYSGGRTNG